MEEQKETTAEEQNFEASVQIGEIKIQGYSEPAELAALIIEMLQHADVKSYLKTLEDKKKIGSASYTD